MIDIIQLVFWWLQDNPTVIAAIIGAVPAIMAALWARRAKKETEPNHGKSLRDTIDQINERQIVLMRNDAASRARLDDVVEGLNEHYEQGNAELEQIQKDRDLIRRLAESVFLNNDDTQDFPPQK